MKKIINGSLYNTDTARLVGEWDNGVYGNDFRSCSETLYQTRSGKYFIHGEGGPMSTYAVHHGNNTSGSEQIRELTVSEAREWAEEKLEADEYIKEFGPVDEAAGPNKKPLNIMVSPEIRTLLEAKSTEMNMSMSKLIELAVLEIYKTE